MLAPKLLQRIAEDDNQPHVELLAHFKTYDTRLEAISSALLTELHEAGPSGHLYIEGLITALAAHLIHTYTNIHHSPPVITKDLPTIQLRKITDLIEDRLTENIGLAELGLNPSRFSSMFRNATGLLPHTYIVQRRLERAQYLLRATRLSIGEIASAVEFYDQSHLVRHMQKVMGVTPSYIQNHLY